MMYAGGLWCALLTKDSQFHDFGMHTEDDALEVSEVLSDCNIDYELEVLCSAKWPTKIH